MNGTLTETEENLIKDVLQELGQDSAFDKQIVKKIGMPMKQYVKHLDSIFLKLGNGRLIVN